MPTPGLDIFVNRLTGDIVLLRSAGDPRGFSLSWGDLVHLTKHDFGDRGLQVILQDLAEYPSRTDCGLSEYDRMDKASKKVFSKEHKQVGVCLRTPADLWLSPMHYGTKPGSMTGGPSSEIQKLSIAGLTQVQFMERFATALAIAD